MLGDRIENFSGAGQERKEDRDTIQAINALTTDEKVKQLEKQQNQMGLAQRRPPPLTAPRPRNTFQAKVLIQQFPSNQLNIRFPSAPRFQRNPPRARFGQQYFQPWYPTYVPPPMPSTTDSGYGQAQLQPGPSSRTSINS
ncbi:hypothetical protein Aduo_016438 [Ancylostoma duodenale]